MLIDRLWKKFLSLPWFWFQLLFSIDENGQTLPTPMIRTSKQSSTTEVLSRGKKVSFSILTQKRQTISFASEGCNHSPFSLPAVQDVNHQSCWLTGFERNSSPCPGFDSSSCSVSTRMGKLCRLRWSGPANRAAPRKFWAERRRLVSASLRKRDKLLALHPKDAIIHLLVCRLSRMWITSHVDWQALKEIPLPALVLIPAPVQYRREWANFADSDDQDQQTEQHHGSFEQREEG